MLGLPGLTRAQSIQGVIYKKGASIRVAQALVTNKRTQTIMMSDELGIFSIPAATGDTLLVTKKSYGSEEVVVAGKNDIAIYLSPEIELKGLSVKAQTKQQELAEVMRSYRGKGVFFDGKPPALLFLVSPITGFYELFGKTPGQARHFATYAKNELQEAEVSHRYTKVLVKSSTGLTDDEEIRKFMDFYRPSFEDVKGWNDYELIQKVKKNFDYYQKNKNRIKVSPLSNPGTDTVRLSRD